MREISVDDQTAGSTLAALVRGGGGEPALMAWSAARQLCTRGRVQVNGAVETDPARRLARGDVVRVDPRAPALRPDAFDPNAILYVDNDVVVVDKPAGMLSVPFSPEDKHTLIDRVQAQLRARRGGPK